VLINRLLEQDRPAPDLMLLPRRACRLLVGKGPVVAAPSVPPDCSAPRPLQLVRLQQASLPQPGSRLMVCLQLALALLVQPQPVHLPAR
jgi:hypothetical protein